jgi:hypothetical protein
MICHSEDVPYHNNQRNWFGGNSEIASSPPVFKGLKVKDIYYETN